MLQERLKPVLRLAQGRLGAVARIGVHQGPDDVAGGVLGVQRRAQHIEPVRLVLARAQGPLGTRRAALLECFIETAKARKALVAGVDVAERARLRLYPSLDTEHLRGALVGVQNLASRIGHDDQGTTAVEQDLDQAGLLHTLLDVGMRAQHAQRRALRGALRDLPARLDPQPAAIGRRQAHLHPEIGPLLDMALQLRLDARPVCRVHAAHERVESERERPVCKAEHLVAARIPLDAGRGPVPVPLP